MTDEAQLLTPAEVLINGEAYMRDSKGGLRPTDLVRPMDKLIDETVRKIVGYGLPLADQITRFKGHIFDDIGALEAVLAQEYQSRLGGAKGNMTLTSYDGCLQVKVQVADHIDFGPELQVAKALIDECLNEWAAQARAELRAIVTRAFNTDKQGQINRSEIFMLLRLEIADERWVQAMRAIRDAMRIVGSKTYVRLYHRNSPTGAWQPISIDMAKA